MTMGGFIAAYRNANLQHLSANVQFDYHCVGIFDLLANRNLEDVSVLGLLDFIRLAGSDPYSVCWPFMLLRRSLRFLVGATIRLFRYDFITRQVYDIPPLGASKRSMTGSGAVVDIPRQEVR